MKIIIKSIILFFILMFSSLGIVAQSSGCERLKDDETTRQGYSELIVFKEKRTFRSVRGTAVLGFEGQPLENVFVEVFPYKNNKRIIGCRTGDDGKFSFSKLEKGKYRIKLSKDGGFKITEIHIKISPKSKNDEEIMGVVEVGT